MSKFEEFEQCTNCPFKQRYQCYGPENCYIIQQLEDYRTELMEETFKH